MAITGINLARVSQNLRAFNLLEALRLNQNAMYRVQNSIATGLRFQQPSEDPLRAASASNLDRGLEWMNQVQLNLSKVNSTLNEVDTTMQESLDLLSQAQTLAVQATGDTLSSEERQALLPVVESLLDQLISTGNRRYLNTYLFSGHQNKAPFELTSAGVLYRGDAGRMETIVDTDLSEDSFTVSGQEFFKALSSEIQGAVDLNPAMSRQTRISDLNGALGRGVKLGRIRVATATSQLDIDLTGAATVGDVLEKLAAELPTGLSVGLGPTGLVVRRGDAGLGAVTVSDVAGGRTAADLGLAGNFDAAARFGEDLDPRLTLLTPLTSLRAGAGLDLAGGLIIRNGPQSATIRFDDTETVEDLLNQINRADIGVMARIADDGSSLTLRNCLSGADLSIEENGGRAATALGLRSLHEGTALAALNDGRGVETVAGGDCRIVCSDGTTVDVSLAGATTLQDVIDRFNAQGGGAIRAALATQGNGLVITDFTRGGGTTRIEALNASPALGDLGLDVTATGNQLKGRDVNPIQVDSPFTALLELRDAISNDNRQALVNAAQRLDGIITRMQEVQGQMASRARMMSDRVDRIDTEITATKVLLSDVRDVDMAEAAVRFAQLQTALQANMSTASKVLNLSVLDYLR